MTTTLDEKLARISTIVASYRGSSAHRCAQLNAELAGIIGSKQAIDIPNLVESLNRSVRMLTSCSWMLEDAMDLHPADASAEAGARFARAMSELYCAVAVVRDGVDPDTDLSTGDSWIWDDLLGNGA